GGRQRQIPIDRIERRADAALMILIVRRAVEDERDGQPVVRIAESGGGAVAAVPEGVVRGEVAVTVGRGVRTVPFRVDDETEPPVENVEERRVDDPLALAGGEGLDRLRQEDAAAEERAAAEQHLVEA